MNEEEIFHEALARNLPDERAAYLDRACADNPGLRAAVEALLRANVGTSGFLSGPMTPLAEAAAGSPVTKAEDVDTDDADSSLDFLEPSEKPDSLGRLGHYEVLEVIGRGGMGVVLRALDEKLHRVVAIKVMAAQLASNGTARKRFTREAQAAAAVSHDHIVTIHAVEEAAGHPYLVMQYVSGMSLQERLDRNGPLQLAEIVRIGMQTASALAAAHAQGVVHRDIKPSNILLENSIERVKVTDFGLARAVTDASLTQSGVVAGTPQFMSPEQARGEAVDQRTDLFSLGSVLYAMCTGRAPFRASGSMAVLKRVCEETPRPIRASNADIPDWLVALIDKLHAKDPAGRYQTVAEVADVLNQHLAHLQHPSIVPLPATRPAKLFARRRRRIMATVALLSLICGAIVLISAWPRLFAPEDTPVVKDGPEGKTPPAVAAKADPRPFVLLGGKAVAERKFDSLAEAVQGASDGDTIEVRGNGPFVCDRINITQALTIRAGEGFRPVINLTVAPKPFHQGGLIPHAPLVLEGLEFRVLDPDEMNGKVTHTVIVPLKALRVANCRFSTDFTCLADYSTSPFSVLEFRNCEFLGSNQDSRAVAAWFASGQKVILENCVSTMRCAIGGGVLTPKEPTFQFTHNTFRAYPSAVEFMDATDKTRDLDDAKKGNNVLLVEASGNVFDCNRVLVFSQHPPGKILSPADAEIYLAQVVGWKGERNLYSVSGQFLTLWSIEKGHQDLAKPTKKLADWKQFWTTAEDNSIEGLVRYHGGDLLAKVNLSPEKVTPEDFRLHRDSAGYRAGKDGRDLGADVDLVGPGPAYERWKKTPEYQKWLKDTKQVAKNLDPDRKAAKHVPSIRGTACVNEENRDLKAAADLN